MSHELNMHVLKLTRCPHQMVKLLDSEGEFLGFCRDSLRVQGYTHRENDKAVRIYVRPEQYEAVMEAVDKMSLEKWNIIACDFYRERLEAAAKSLPSRLQVKVKTIRTFKLDLATQETCRAL